MSSSESRTASRVLPASALASAITACIVNPLDVLRVRQQKGSTGNNCDVHSFRKQAVTHKVNHHHSKLHCKTQLKWLSTNLIKCIQNSQHQIKINNLYQNNCICIERQSLSRGMMQLWRMEGLRTLFSGLPFSVYTFTASTACYFFFYEKSRQIISNNITKHQVGLPLLAATISRAFTTFLTFPLEFIRTRQHGGVQNHQRLSIKTMAGPFSSSLQRDILFSSIYWVLAENIRDSIKSYNNIDKNDTTSVWTNISAGFFAGAATSLLTLPLDVAKTRRQLHPLHESSKSSFLILKTIFDQKGVHGLFLGARPRIAKSVLSCSSMLSLYEYFLELSYQLY